MMTPFRFEGGPLDGKVVETNGAPIVRVPIPMPLVVVRNATPDAPIPDVAIPVGEYRRSGAVYRFETLIDDAQAGMEITAEAFIEPTVRRYARQSLRRKLQELAPDKELGAVVWAIGYAPRVAMFSLAAFVGGRRREYAAIYRQKTRLSEDG